MKNLFVFLFFLFGCSAMEHSVDPMGKPDLSSPMDLEPMSCQVEPSILSGTSELKDATLSPSVALLSAGRISCELTNDSVGKYFFKMSWVNLGYFFDYDFIGFCQVYIPLPVNIRAQIEKSTPLFLQVEMDVLLPPVLDSMNKPMRNRLTTIGFLSALGESIYPDHNVVALRNPISNMEHVVIRVTDVSHLHSLDRFSLKSEVLLPFNEDNLSGSTLTFTKPVFTLGYRK